jgi:C-terminal processing protease CtpA/Prc
MINKNPLRAAACALVLFSCGTPISAIARAPDAVVTAGDRGEAFNVLIRRLDHYVMADRKPVIVAELQEQRAALLAIEDPEAFRAAVNRVLLETSGDKHLQVWLNRERGADGEQPTFEQMTEVERRQGFGIDAIRRLHGNIGYLRLRGFSGHPGAGAAIDGAMSVLSGADALILDLRRNGGGGEAALKRLMGHLAAAPVELESIEMRVCAPPPAEAPDACVQDGTRETQRRWADTVAAPTFADRPIYVLTSTQTFSAAEAVAYGLQQAGRAVVVGEVTGGGANISAAMDLNARFLVIMPIGEARHPLSGTNWEGAGVQPDVTIPADQALTRAYGLALARSGGRAEDAARLLEEDGL